MILKDKVAAITGASDGIGRQIAMKLASKGVLLALIARNESRLEEVKQECLKLGSKKVNFYVCDITDSSVVAKTFEKINTDFGNIDVLINDAGIWQKLSNLEDISNDIVDGVINTNLKGLIFVTKYALPLLKKDTESAIINVSSRSGVVANERQSVYSASKWGVTGFTEVLKVDLKNSNIRVSGLYQGKTQTDIFSKTGDGVDTSRGTKPEDLADVVVFMLSRPSQIWLHDVRVEY